MGSRSGSREPRKSRVPSGMAALCSLFVPGLGQILAGQVRRGLLLFSSLMSILVLLFWRIHLLAHREIGALAKVSKAFDRRPFFVGLLLSCSAFLWLWNSWDASSSSSSLWAGRLARSISTS
jgi:TM2 domain-containing membrane protein YozV